MPYKDSHLVSVSFAIPGFIFTPVTQFVFKLRRDLFLYIESVWIRIYWVGLGSLPCPLGEANISNLHEQFAVELGPNCKLIAEHVKSTVNTSKATWFLHKILVLFAQLFGRFSLFLKNQCWFCKTPKLVSPKLLKLR